MAPCSPREVQQERLLTTLASIEQSAVKWDNIRQMNDLQLESYAELGCVYRSLRVSLFHFPHSFCCIYVGVYYALVLCIQTG